MSVTPFWSSVMSSTVYIDEINKLPDEIIMEIFKYLPPCSIDACELVCQRWAKLACDPSVWREIVFVYSGRPQVQKEHAYNMKIIETQSEKVHCLKVQYIENYQNVYRIISMCRNITSLELTMCTIDHLFEKITELKNLRKLCLKNSILRRSDAISDVTVQFDTLKYLNYLELSEFGLNSNNCDSLMRCKYLCVIKIRKVKGLTLEYIKKLINCKKETLKIFQVYGDDAIDNKCLQLLSECPVLEDLAIVRCERLTDEGFSHLAKFKNLSYLQIWNNSNITERCLTETLDSANLVKLIRLSFSKIANVSPSTVDVISEKYTRLKFLALYQCPKVVGGDYEKQLKAKFRNISIVLY